MGIQLSLLAFLQSNQQSAEFAHDHHLLLVFIGMVAIALLVQALCVLGAALVLFATAKKAQVLVQETHGAVNAVVHKVDSVVLKVDGAIAAITPKLTSIVEHSERMTATVHEKVDELAETVSSLNRTVGDVNLRARAQIAHADRLVGSTLTSTEEVRDALVDGIKAPVRQIAGLLAGLRVGLQTLIDRSPFAGR